MAFLIWDANDFGQRFVRAGYPEIRAHFATVAEAIAQAEHDLTRGRTPLRVEDEHGQIVWTPKGGS